MLIVSFTVISGKIIRHVSIYIAGCNGKKHGDDRDYWQIVFIQN